MQLTYVPLLVEQRELYHRPRDRKRFKAYLHLTIDFETQRVRLPTLGMNPMAREHVGAFLDGLLALGADAVGAVAMREAEPVCGTYPERTGWRSSCATTSEAGGRTGSRASTPSGSPRRPHPARVTSTGSPGRCGSVRSRVTDMRTHFECLFGDAAGATLGFTPRGLSDRGGLALALHDARTVGGFPASR